MNLKNKNVLVTGADGFIGSHLVEEILNHGAKIKAFVLYNSFNSWGWLDQLDKKILNKIEVIAGDIRDKDFLEQETKNIDVIFHLAALIAIPYSYNAPESYIDTNIKGTLNILSAAKKNNVKRVLVTSTSEVYGTAKYVPIDEAHPFQGQSPYSASKIGADRIAESFFKSFNLPVTIVRPFNAYGPRQSARAVIPTIITQILQGHKTIKLGNLNPTRDLNYVTDVVKAYIEILGSKKTIGEEINISTNNEISINELCKKIIKISGKKITVKSENNRIRPTKSEVDRLIGDNKKILKLTNWRPAISLDNGLQKTYRWLSQKENLQKYKANIYNL